jgi:thymidylate synthase (FAD)
VKLITEPTVYLLGRQEVDRAELDRFLADHGVAWESDSDVGAEVITETAGRVCYMSFAKPRPGGNRTYLDHIKEVGHGSVVEHAVFNLLVTGVSRSLSHELVRHRAGWAYSMLSQRYVDESVAEYVVPPDLREEVGAAEMLEEWCKGYMETSGESWAAAEAAYYRHHPGTRPEAVEAGRTWRASIDVAHAQYCQLSDYLAKKAEARGLQKTDGRKFARQAARSVLPNATETKLAVTVNARAARHFLEQRGSRHADPEIRVLAVAVWKALKADSPSLFGDYEENALPDGTVELSTPYPKV